ncbi:MAG: hypothetical protein IJD43_09795 [Thermoguttaceae bacterium]|nr:hypothetical protein [Thermoguttaceae bacterium]
MKKTAIFAILCTAFLTVSQAFGTVYFVSPSGNDENDGKSEKTPWASISRVNSAEEIQPGDEILWQRGGIWRGVLLPHSGEPGKPVRYGAYGDPQKAKPTFYGSVDASTESSWTEEAPNIWATREMETEILGDVPANFDQQWSIYREPEIRCPIVSTFENGVRKLTFDCAYGGKTRNQIQVWGPELKEKDLPQTMLLKLRVRANCEMTLSGPAISLQKAPWTTKAVSPALKVGTEWQTVELLMDVNDTKLPQEGDYRFVWHWSIGGMPENSRLETEFLSLKEVRVDRSLFLPVDVGNIIFDHGNFKKYHRCGIKKWKLEDLKTPGDYFYDPEKCRVFLYWDENPAKTCESIELAVRTTVINQSNVHDVIYEDLAVAYGAAHGFGGINTARLTIRRCDLYYIGGGHQFTHENGMPVRFGNAIEFWNSAEDCLVEKCWIREVYDAALTNQGKGTETAPSNQVRITYRENLIENSEYSFEYWNRGGKTEDILFEKNVCRNAGVCWSHTQRPNPNGAHLMFYQNSAETKNVVVRDNIFHDSTEVCLRMENDWLAGLKLEKNDYRQHSDAPVIRWLGKNYFDAENFGEWQKISGQDADSTVKPRR